MQIDMRNQSVLITGSTQGIGAQIARRAAGAGAEHLVLTGRDEERGAAMAHEIEGLGCHCHFVAADLAEEDAAVRLFEAALEKTGRIDALVNSAALTTRGSVEDAEPALWQKLMRVNAEAPFFLIQRLVRHLKARGAPGSVVNIVSMNAHCGTPELAVYSATKAALALVTKNAANAHLHDRIRLNAIALGWADTEGERHMQADILGKGEDWNERAARDLPQGRMITADDAARMALFLLSEASMPTTGAIVDQAQWVVGAPA